jgi:hypothetical protein
MTKSTTPFAHFKETPSEALNWRLGLSVAVVGLVGAARGREWRSSSTSSAAQH